MKSAKAVIRMNPEQPQDRNAPPDVTINTIAEWMRHYPEWQHALIKRVNELESYDLWELKERAVTITDSPNIYSAATRRRVDLALDGDDVAVLQSTVLEAEAQRRKAVKQ